MGEPVAVGSALALPGWFVERTSPDGPLVSNPRTPAVLAEPRGGDHPPDALIRGIAHRLEQRCRDLAPRAFREEAG